MGDIFDTTNPLKPVDAVTAREAAGFAVRPDDGNWGMLSSREREYLSDVESKAHRVGQLSRNTEWLIAQFDAIHEALCDGHIGTWQTRVLKSVEASKTVKRELAEARKNCHKAEAAQQLCYACGNELTNAAREAGEVGRG
jgi:hypothetical protein